MLFSHLLSQTPTSPSETIFEITEVELDSEMISYWRPLVKLTFPLQFHRIG